MTVTLETPTARPTGAPALTYPERTLIAGDLDAGLVLGYTAGNTNAPGRKWITRSRAAYAAFRKPHGYASAADMLTPPTAQLSWESRNDALRLCYAGRYSRHGAIPTRLAAGQRVPYGVKGCAAACLRNPVTVNSRQRNAPGKFATRSYWPIHSMPAC